MDRIRIRGGVSLNGNIDISGAKNAALPLMAAALLSDEPLTLTNLPRLADIDSMADLLEDLGVDLIFNGDHTAGRDSSSRGQVVKLIAKNITGITAPYDVVRKMRASVLILGPLLARQGQARVSLPGGCAIGTRPVDMHLQAFEELGAEIELTEGYIHARAPSGLTGTHLIFPMVTVGGTENALMAAVLSRGETVIGNAAKEPEVIDLATCLVAMGAKIEGVGSDTLYVEGVERLHGATHEILPDRIEAGSYAIAAAITGGTLVLKNVRSNLLEATVDPLLRAGVEVVEIEEGLCVRSKKGILKGIDLITEPFPGFPTDMQTQFMALMSVADGASMITETIFENRFMHVPELCRMGADINVHGASAIIRGVSKLSGAPVMATDLRASISLILAGLAADGETVVNRIYHLDRGYESVEKKLAACGAEIERINE